MTADTERTGHTRRGDDVEVLIVGAGPTGLSLAVQLHRFGVRFRLVDRLADRIRESRALAIQPRTLEVFDGVGIAQALIERGNDAVEVRLHAGGRVAPIRLFDLGLEDTAFPFLLFLSQAETERVLREHLARHGVHVERRVELFGFTAGEDAVACRLQHGGGPVEEIGSQYLVGCDGAHSMVRRGAGIAFEGGTYPQTFVLADLEVDGGLEPGCVHVFMGPHGMLFFFPLEHPASWRMQSMLPESGAEESRVPDGEPSLEALQAIVDTFTDGQVRLRDPVWRTYFRIPRRQAVSYRSGRVFLAGDAAHVHSPAGAQGMNTGIQDAWNLGWKLALAVKGRARPAVLDSYEAERWPIGRSVLRLSDRPFRMATSESRLFRLIRRHVVPRLAPLVPRADAGRAYVFRRLAQLEIRYRKSPIVREGTPRLGHGPRAGDRLPDAPLENMGQRTSLHREVADPGFHLLLCGPVQSWDAQHVTALCDRYPGLLTAHHLTHAPAPGTLADIHGEAFARLGVKDTAHYLVRPDGHVAYRAGGADPEALSQYMARWFPGTDSLPRTPHAQ